MSNFPSLLTKSARLSSLISDIRMKSKIHCGSTVPCIPHLLSWTKTLLTPPSPPSRETYSLYLPVPPDLKLLMALPIILPFPCHRPRCNTIAQLLLLSPSKFVGPSNTFLAWLLIARSVCQNNARYLTSVPASFPRSVQKHCEPYKN